MRKPLSFACYFDSSPLSSGHIFVLLDKTGLLDSVVAVLLEKQERVLW